MQTYEITVTGLVQGVGYRPFVARVAKELGLKGTVRNTGGIVKINITAENEAVESLIHRLYKYYPKGAKVESVTATEVAFTEYTDFSVILSDDNNSLPVLPYDIGICPDCLSELNDKKNRRFRYPFITCAACGPRYTIMHNKPYDRENTTMKDYPLCDKCREEYLDAENSRFYAQTISCKECGPKLFYASSETLREALNTGTAYVAHAPNTTTTILTGEEAYASAVSDIKNGEVIAVKNIGGYHLVADATNSEAVSKLRELKRRERKAYAVLFNNTTAVEKYAKVSAKEKELLESDKRPIVLLKYDNTGERLAKEVCVNSSCLGAMLPANGLQAMLSNDFETLVMTSANITGSPMIIKEEDIIDLGVKVLYNDREILTPLDDSVVRIVEGRTLIIRRGRGYTPDAIYTKDNFGDETLCAYGADMKATIAYAKGDRVYLSQSVGDASYVSVQNEIKNIKKRMETSHRITPEVFIADKHPKYLSREFGRIDFEIYHHEAHASQVLLEHGIHSDAVCLTYDGTGYGEDGKSFGGEVFLYENRDLKRVNHLKPVTLISGDEGTKNSAMILAGFAYALGSEREVVEYSYDEHFEECAEGLVYKAIENGINTYETSSLGRVFDAVAALLGVSSYNEYEGASATELTYAAEKYEGESPSKDVRYYKLYELVKATELDTVSIIKELALLKKSGEDVKKLAYAFHEIIAIWSVEVARSYNKENLALAGGCMANALLVSMLIKLGESSGMKVYINELVPPGDDGITLGQFRRYLDVRSNAR